jgi:hypothetical protein
MRTSPYSDLLTLSTREFLAQGGTRRVYEHPEFADLLVKVLRPKPGNELPGKKRRRWKLRRRAGKYITHMRELREYLAVRANLDRHPTAIERPYGLVETDLGLGLVVEKLCGKNGGVAETLRERLAQNGFTKDLRDKLAELRRTVFELDIILGDLNTGNVVLACDETGRERMVVIDGIGDKALVPLASWSKWFNRFNNYRLFRRIEARLEQRGAALMRVRNCAAAPVDHAGIVG